jgi:hypothetical protein
MLRFLLSCLLAFSQVPAFADQALDEALARIAQESEQRVIWTKDLREATRKLFEEYQWIMNAPAGANLNEYMRTMTAKFTRDFETWSMAVARNTFGPAGFRQGAQRFLCGYTLDELARSVPVHSLTIDNEFATDFIAELRRLNSRQQARLKQMEGQFGRRTSSLNFKEGTTCVLAALTLFELIQAHAPQFSHPTAVGWAAALLGFFTMQTVLKDVVPEKPNDELVAQKLATSYSSNAENICARLLNHQR